MTSNLDTEPYKESSLARITSTEGVEPKYLTISMASPLSNQIIPSQEDFLLVMGSQALNFKGPLVIVGLSLGKGGSTPLNMAR